ncbi:reticulocalbin-2 isoform 1-T3 [Synchiropus picturatus]
MGTSSLLAWTLLLFELCSGQSSHQHLHDDRYFGQQHNSDHDMNILMGEKENVELKKLTPAEQKMKMMELVQRIDRNADHLLSEEEITLWIQHVYRKYAMEDAEERFPKFDTNEDGVVTWEEYNMVVHDQLLPFDEDVLSEDPEQESLRQLHLRERKRFDFADADDKPGLNVSEFLAFTHPSEVDRMADFAVEDVLNQYDRDADGFITLKEFIGDVRGEDGTPSQWEIEETVRFQELYDQDKDGKLNREEQLRWVAPNSYSSAREEALHLIREMDQNGDGRISEAEVLKNQDLFMNSEVTDYGQQLHASHDEL